MKTRLFIILLTAVTLCACDKSNYPYLEQIPKATDTSAVYLQGIVHLLDSGTADQWTKQYLMYKDSICKNSIRNNNQAIFVRTPNSESFNKQSLLKLLSLPGCVGVNIAYGMDENYRLHDIIYGVDTSFHLMYIHDTTMNAIKKMMTQKHSLKAAPPPNNQGAYALETGQMCPSYCPVH